MQNEDIISQADVKDCFDANSNAFLEAVLRRADGQELREQSYIKRYDANCEALVRYGQEASREHTRNKAERLVDFAAHEVAKKVVGINRRKERASIPLPKTVCMRSDKAHAQRLARQRSESYLWFRRRVSGPFYGMARVDLCNLAGAGVAEADQKLKALEAAVKTLPDAIVIAAPTTDGRIEPVLLTSRPLTKQETEGLGHALGSQVRQEIRHKTNLNSDLEKWAKAGTHLPQDDDLRMKFEAVLETHQQVRSNVPRKERKKCKEENTNLHFLFRGTWKINGLPVIGTVIVDECVADDSVPLCLFEYSEPPPWPLHDAPRWEN